MLENCFKVLFLLESLDCRAESVPGSPCSLSGWPRNTLIDTYSIGILRINISIWLCVCVCQRMEAEGWWNAGIGSVTVNVIDVTPQRRKTKIVDRAAVFEIYLKS